MLTNILLSKIYYFTGFRQISSNWILGFTVGNGFTWWRHQMEIFLRNWMFVRGIHRSPVGSLQKGQWRGALTFSLIFAWTNGRANNRDAGDLRSNRAHYDVTVMTTFSRPMQRHDTKWNYKFKIPQIYSSHKRLKFPLSCVNSLRPSDAYASVI